MNIFLTGKNGQLGSELQRTLAPLGTIHASDIEDMDFRDLPRLRDFVRELKPDAIVNASAYTAVDRAESQAEIAQDVNGSAPGVMAEEARRLRAAFIHFSTDYVFDGSKGSPYIETDPPNPLGVYGSSKLAGEQATQAAGGAYLIFRTSWVYSTDKPSFVTKLLGWARQHETLRIVDDQTSNPTWCRTLAEIVAQLLEDAGPDAPAWIKERRGLYHLAAEGAVSRYTWAKAILANAPRTEELAAREILPAKSTDFPTPAARPVNSSLDCGLFDATFGIPRPGWEEALRRALQSPRENPK
ncbi:MAG: dTDP-4-dehydrorhamnose reductase [Anaerolineales bacterium]|nr:dTDP-4-dehydrorhamnose reductase [Anaerolineales bacterium]